MHRIATVIRRTIRAALSAGRALAYTARNGHLATELAAGRLIRTGDLLGRLGIDLLDGQQSWYGRHVAKAYRVRTGMEPVRCWVRHRTTGRWIHVAVYAPTDPALVAGLHSYKATRNLIPAVTLAA